ncbi:MAG: hypothetical protein ACT4QB_14225 [Gammaproteobacteria bacterium]
MAIEQDLQIGLGGQIIERRGQGLGWNIEVDAPVLRPRGPQDQAQACAYGTYQWASFSVS